MLFRSYAHVPTGGELLCKTLMLLLVNALALVLGRSENLEVRTLTPAMLRELLLGRPCLASIDADGVTLWAEPLPDAYQRRIQAELIKIFDEAALRTRHGRLRLRTRKPIYDPPLRGL